MHHVVFNAHYLAYCDDAVMCWFSARLGARMLHEFDCMLKTVNITWQRPLRVGETASLDCHVARWGNSSFDVVIDGHVAGESNRASDIIIIIIIDEASVEPCQIITTSEAPIKPLILLLLLRLQLSLVKLLLLLVRLPSSLIKLLLLFMRLNQLSQLVEPHINITIIKCP